MDTRVSSPWFVGNWPDGTDAISVRAESPEGPRIASCGGAYRFATSEANAAYIVEACNNYESLTADRDTLKALCVELADALYRADHSDLHAGLIERARSLK